MQIKGKCSIQIFYSASSFKQRIGIQCFLMLLTPADIHDSFEKMCAVNVYTIFALKRVYWNDISSSSSWKHWIVCEKKNSVVEWNMEEWGLYNFCIYQQGLVYSLQGGAPPEYQIFMFQCHIQFLLGQIAHTAYPIAKPKTLLSLFFFFSLYLFDKQNGILE